MAFNNASNMSLGAGEVLEDLGTATFALRLFRLMSAILCGHDNPALPRAVAQCYECLGLETITFNRRNVVLVTWQLQSSRWSAYAVCILLGGPANAELIALRLVVRC